MFYSKQPEERSGLEDAIDRIFVDMAIYSSESDEYAKMADQLSKLYSLKEIDSPQRLSPDVMATISANLLGIVLIVGHERAHVVTSKAVNFIKKLW